MNFFKEIITFTQSSNGTGYLFPWLVKSRNR